MDNLSAEAKTALEIVLTAGKNPICPISAIIGA
jgi:hypothetical protein